MLQYVDGGGDLNDDYLYGVEVVMRKVKKILFVPEHQKSFSHAKDDYNVYFWRELSIFVFLGLVFNQCIFAI